MRRDLERRLRALQSRIEAPPYSEARASWIESGLWPSGRVRQAILAQEQILLQMRMRGPIDNATRREMHVHLAAVEAAQRGDAEAEQLVLELARERERLRL